MESLLRACESSDLSDIRTDLGMTSDLDVLRAAGAVAQHHPAALAAWRLLELGDQRAAREVFDHLVARLIDRGHDSDPIHTAAAVLEWMANPICPACHGRGFEVAPGTPVLTDKECGHCHGTGKRPREWSDAAHDLHEWLLGEQRQAAAEIIRKLKRD